MNANTSYNNSGGIFMENIIKYADQKPPQEETDTSENQQQMHTPVQVL